MKRYYNIFYNPFHGTITLGEESYMEINSSSGLTTTASHHHNL